MKHYIDSHSQEGVTYEVTLTAQGGNCTCPQYVHRCAGVEGAECKHVRQARADRAARLAAKAKALSDAELEALRVKYSQKDASVWVAILGEIHDREAAASRETSLKALFA